MKIKASLFNKSSASSTVHTEHINVSTDFSRLFDINDDLLRLIQRGAHTCPETETKVCAVLLLTRGRTLCDYMHFKDITKLFLHGRILWPLLSTEKLPKCHSTTADSQSADRPHVCKVFGRCLTDKCRVPWTSEQGNQ